MGRGQSNQANGNSLLFGARTKSKVSPLPGDPNVDMAIWAKLAMELNGQLLSMPSLETHIKYYRHDSTFVRLNLELGGKDINSFSAASNAVRNSKILNTWKESETIEYAILVNPAPIQGKPHPFGFAHIFKTVIAPRVNIVFFENYPDFADHAVGIIEKGFFFDHDRLKPYYDTLPLGSYTP